MIIAMVVAATAMVVAAIAVMVMAHQQRKDKQYSQNNAANDVENLRSLMAAGLFLNDTRSEPFGRQQIVDNQAKTDSSDDD